MAQRTTDTFDICINVVLKIHSELVYVTLAHTYMQSMVTKLNHLQN